MHLFYNSLFKKNSKHQDILNPFSTLNSPTRWNENYVFFFEIETMDKRLLVWYEICIKKYIWNEKLPSILQIC